MKVERLIGLMMVVTTLTGCTDQVELTSTSDVPVSVSLAFSLPEEAIQAGTRMADSVVQISSDKYRGLQDVHLIPFTKEGKIGLGDEPFIYEASRDESGRVWNKPNSSCPDAAFYYYPDCIFKSGTASVLFYGRGAYSVQVNGSAISGDDKSYYGSTAATMTNLAPASISFSPVQIHTSTAPDAKANALTQYMTSIANTEGWSTTDDAKLKALYLNFTKRDAVIAGSSACIEAFVEELYIEVGKREADNELAEAIRNKIKEGADVTGSGDEVTLTLKDNLSGYPTNIGLPDGAAAMKWDGTAFLAQTTTTVESAITSIDRFVYPAELYYYGNSTLKTSRKKVEESIYQTENTWEGVLNNYTGTVVDAGIKSAAMVSSVQYGVGRLSVRLNKITHDLLDAKGDIVTWDDTSFPLTAIIVGGQYPVGFDFRPETFSATPSDEEKDEALRYIYDSQVRTNKKSDDTYDYYYMSKTGDTGYANTLVLQSYNGEKVSIVLEFENNSGKKFMGHDGIVYPGTKFYLVGTVNPALQPSTGDNGGRVFTQDFTTKFNMGVESLKYAYNVMPDLLAPRMEIGVRVVNWETLRPTVIELQK